MLTIQEVGGEILNDRPRNFYVFCGTENGIKDKYIEHLTKYYGNKVELDTFAELEDRLSYEPLISVPTLYVIRYDKEFLSSVDAKTINRLNNLYIDGTVILVYGENAGSKISKYLPEYTIDMPNLNSTLKLKYLHKDFPEISEVLLQVIIKLSSNYLVARNICLSISNLPVSVVNDLSSEDIENMFIVSKGIDEKLIQSDVEHRDVCNALRHFDNYTGELSYIFYTIMNTMVSLDKYQNPQGWNKSDIIAYNDIVYKWLINSRIDYVSLPNLIQILLMIMGISPIVR